MIELLSHTQIPVCSHADRYLFEDSLHDPDRVGDCHVGS